jgi:hypothetical protein
MRRSLPAVVLLALVPLALGAAACGGSDEPPPPMTKGGCGMPAYEWLPKAQVGHVVTSRESERTGFTAQTVDIMAAVAGGAEYFSPAPYGMKLFHLRYTTQDRGQQVEATGLVSVPWNAGDERRSYPVVLFLHGTSGFMGECAPSSMVDDDGAILPFVLLSSQGYIVIGPDYIGMDADADFTQPPPVKHAYLGLEQAAIGSLDMVRAGRELLAANRDMNADPGDDLVIWGGSQGGHAAFASDLVAPYYAPELDVRATVALVPPTDLLGIGAYALGSVNDATAAFAAALTALNFWHQGSASLDTLFTSGDPYNFPTKVPDLMYSGCDPEGAFDGATEISQVYLPDVIDKGTTNQWDALQPWGCYLETNSITWSPITRLRDTPTLFVVSQNDTLVYAPAERDDFPRLCAQGRPLQYLECADAEHAEGAIWSLPEQVAWVKDRLDGKPIAAADLCVRKDAVRCLMQPAN